MYGDLKYTFIESRLRAYLDDVRETMLQQMQRDNVEGNNELEKSIRGVTEGGESYQAAELIFKESGRFVDMGVGRGHPLGGVKQTRKALKGARPNGRRRKQIYARIAYGKLNYLENQLLYGYTEEAIAMLKKQLENGTGARQ